METENVTPPAESRADLAPEIENAQALAFWLGPLHCVIAWRDGPQRLRPADGAKRIRDIQPGDEVFWRDEPRTVRSVAVYR